MVYQLIQKRARPCWPDSASGLEGRVKASLPAGIVAGSLVFLALVMPIARSDASPQPVAAPKAVRVIEPMPAPRHPREKTYMKRKWGVEILFLRETAAGYMLEFRYKVLDPVKAAPLFVRKTKPVVTHVRTGKQLTVPVPAKTGALRNSDTPLADHTYWMFFANPNKLVKPGDLVNLQVGDFAVEGLVVM
jgi:hypothetical protein